LSAGSVITSKIVLGNNVTVGANSVVNKSFPRGNALLVGAPAAFKADRAAWYDEEEGIYKQRVEAINQLKIQMIP
jgi:serine acetyltransferase